MFTDSQYTYIFYALRLWGHIHVEKTLRFEIDAY